MMGMKSGASWFEPVAEGVLLRCDTDHLDWFARKLAGMPFPFEVRTPDALRDSLAALAARLLASAARPARPDSVTVVPSRSS